MYSTRLTVFAAVAAVILMALPAANIASRATVGGALIPQDLRDLWSLDRIEGNLSYLAMTQFGRSLFPDRVEIGREGYLFLGDESNGVMAKTAGTWPVPDGLIEAQASALARLQSRVSDTGAQFTAVIAPNKHSIYPEMLPEGTPPAPHTVTDDLIDAAAARNVPILDLRPVLRHAKDRTQAYLKTDTHWTQAGGAAAYDAVMARIGAEVADYDLEPVAASAGDLTHLLKMQDLYPPKVEQDYRIGLSAPPATCAAQISLISGDETACAPVQNGGLIPMDKVLRVTRTPDAPNPQTVLMLCDSFCIAPSALYNASFAQVYYIHWKFIDDRALGRYLQRLAPDIVILQMVERDSLSLGLGQ
ncbi:alginate O-acetyltransferase AlgX-related protein [Roseovarius sp. S4756]|uniref:alginate O-acetyltransferase AlgX-related protein n=1 Tax=Roseovarius maritimus TaxID=3342637 RepID=UPI003726AF1F